MKTKLSEKLELSAGTQKIKEEAESKLQEIKASCCAECPPSICPEDFYSAMRNVYDYLDRENRYINSAISDLYNLFYKHIEDGHIPKLSGEAMTRFLEVMKLTDTYEVQKKLIYVQASQDSHNRKNEIIVEFK